MVTFLCILGVIYLVNQYVEANSRQKKREKDELQFKLDKLSEKINTITNGQL